MRRGRDGISIVIKTRNMREINLLKVAVGIGGQMSNHHIIVVLDVGNLHMQLTFVSGWLFGQINRIELYRNGHGVGIVTLHNYVREDNDTLARWRQRREQRWRKRRELGGCQRGRVGRIECCW